VAVHFYS